MNELSRWAIHGVNLGLQLGPLFLAHCFNWGLFGLITLQVYIYYGKFVNDPLSQKILVYAVFCLDAISIACSTYSGFWIFVTNWGNVAVLHHLGWSWATVPASAGLLAFIVQSFYAYRVWRVSQKKNWFIPMLIIILSGSSCGFSFASANRVAKLQYFGYIRSFTPSLLWLSFGIAADFFVCAALVYYFTTIRARFTFTNRLMLRLVLIAVETAIVIIVAASIKIFLIFTRHDNVHIIICLLLPRLYTNTLLGSLNSRSSMFGEDEVQDSLGSRGRRNFWISNSGTARSTFSDKKKSPNVSSSYGMDTDIEPGQVFCYQPIRNSPLISTPPATHSPSAPFQLPIAVTRTTTTYVTM